MLAQTKAEYLNWLNENDYGIWDGTTDATIFGLLRATAMLSR